MHCDLSRTGSSETGNLFAKTLRKIRQKNCFYKKFMKVKEEKLLIMILKLLMLSSQSTELYKLFCAINYCNHKNFWFSRSFFPSEIIFRIFPRKLPFAGNPKQNQWKKYKYISFMKKTPQSTVKTLIKLRRH